MLNCRHVVQAIRISNSRSDGLSRDPSSPPRPWCRLGDFHHDGLQPLPHLPKVRIRSSAVLRYHVCDTLLAVEKAISIRLDDEAQRALGALTATGRKQSEVVREALIELAHRQDRVSLVAEVERLNADPRDRAEKAQIGRLMDALRAKG